MSNLFKALYKNIDADLLFIIVVFAVYCPLLAAEVAISVASVVLSAATAALSAVVFAVYCLQGCPMNS